MSNSNLPPVPEGAAVYVHPQQGKTVYVLPDGSMQVYRANGSRTTSSATPAKLAAGYGAWELVDGDTLAPTSSPAPAAVQAAAAAYIAPQLALEAELTMIPTLVQNDDVVFEQKLDGNRVLLVSPGGNSEPIALTRNGQPYTKGLPRAVREWRFPEGNAHGAMVLDGELVGDTYWVFDMPKSAATSDDTPLSVRRYALEQVWPFIGARCTAMRLVPQAKTAEEKQALYDTAVQNNFEGLIAKRKNALYRWGGRTEEWLKLKFTTTADVFVTAVRDDGKESVALGVYDGTDVIDVGRASLIGKEKRGVISKGDVLEVRYLYVGANGRLYQPTIMRRRTDKPIHECNTQQLKHVCKDVLASLDDAR